MFRIFYALAIFIITTVSLHAENTFPALDTFGNGKAHDLDVMIIAEPREVMIGGLKVKSNVYTICPNAKGQTDCPTHKIGSNPYGGAVLRIAKGYHLKITLINKMVGAGLPPDGLLTNLHTHGLLVRARGRNAVDQLAGEKDLGKYEPNSIGDFVFVATMPNSASMSSHSGMAHGATMGPLRYDIEVPANHPSGIFWFHPHVHGLSKMQVSGGMAGMIEVVDPQKGPFDDLCLTLDPATKKCAAGSDKVSQRPDISVRQIMLKDAQLINLDQTTGKATMFYDQDAGFCGGNATADNPMGFCNSDTVPAGRWVYSLNGAMLPNWTARGPKAGKPGNTEILQIQNASANITYNLCFSGGGFTIDHATGSCDTALPFQVLSADGVAFGSAQGQAAAFVGLDALQRRVVLMPGSRIELLVTPRDPANCNPNGDAVATAVNCPPGFAATSTDFTANLENLTFDTGGDSWPRGRLAQITFKGRGVQMAGLITSDLTPAPMAMNTMAFAPTARMAAPATAEQLCNGGLAHKLAQDERRRVYFAIVSDEGLQTAKKERFLLGHTYIDAAGVERDDGGQPATTIQLRPFVMAENGAADLCAFPGLPGETETWQLVNLSEEVHNFHIHQGKFTISRDAIGPRLRATDATDMVNVGNGIVKSDGTLETNLVHDTIIVPRAKKDTDGNSICPTTAFDATGTATGFLTKSGSSTLDAPIYNYDPTQACSASTSTAAGGDRESNAGWIEISIPFDQLTSRGKYVFHCHILEHEDLGMMSSIRVLTDEQAALFPQ